MAEQQLFGKFGFQFDFLGFIYLFYFKFNALYHRTK